LKIKGKRRIKKKKLKNQMKMRVNILIMNTMNMVLKEGVVHHYLLKMLIIESQRDLTL